MKETRRRRKRDENKISYFSSVSNLSNVPCDAAFNSSFKRCANKMAARQRYIAKFKEAVESQDGKSFATCFALDELASGPLAREIKDVSCFSLAYRHRLALI
jgi:hypothetical protein